ncbi:uncharacterized protein BHQ10_008279 [Talaromyces amestolkiae]|uniref:Uncharacterized protein n=1 Tax=Talaromyces amestolkiae TaxID=1196081 RepID=A0A364L8Y6_TALAM|nr:uncharacterized protein BHQ10_008279 [Talaromyces amestolkiae]RAO72267.1 hypothetical protein BHQ10_008279 [Talaromyces amestolkiae]
MNALGNFWASSRVPEVTQHTGLIHLAACLSEVPFSFPMPGVQCQVCKQAGRETWVIPGKACHICGALCSLLADEDEIESE